MSKPQTKPTQKQTPIAATTPKPKFRDMDELRELQLTAIEEAHRITVEVNEARTEQERTATYQLVRMVDGGDHDPDKSYNLKRSEFQALESFLKITRQDHGTSTPIDEFLARLVFSHAIRALTPDSIQEDLDQCREAFQDALRDSKQLQKQYPELFAESDSEAA